VTARALDIGKDAGGAAEDIVFQGDAVENGCIVLNLNIVADIYILTNKHILSHGAVFAYMHARHYMGEVPDFSAFADAEWLL
jgi:hypothetical protein